QALFTLFFNNINDTWAPLFTSTGSPTTRAGQGTAAAAWAANCRMNLLGTLGRALAVAGSGSGLSARALGQFTGEENHTLTLSEIPTGIASNGVNSLTLFPNGNSSSSFPINSTGWGGAFASTSGGNVVPVSNASNPISSTNNVSGSPNITVT